MEPDRSLAATLPASTDRPIAPPGGFCSNHRRRIGVFSAVFLCLLSGTSARAMVLDGTVPSYKDAPVFYEFAWEYYGAKENLELMHEGRANVGVMGIVPVVDFDWFAQGKDASYWVAMENFRYLLPLVDSDRSRDRTLVADWINRWITAHKDGRARNPGSMDAMSVGHRAMTFVWYLRKRHQRGEPENEHTARIKNALLDDQRYLATKYKRTSNHGFWEAMGLFETLRVHPDSSLAGTALDRLMEMTRLSVSEQGLHKEHSPDYHFWVWNWLRQYTDYLTALDGWISWSGLEELTATERRMGVTSYYLYDHRRNLAQIGDTDARVVMRGDIPKVVRRRPPRDPILFDDEAGYAINKDRFKRYVVFAIQNRAHAPTMPYHYHDDVLSVYYAHDGEIILGDAGRYAYVMSPLKRYYSSPLAHNTVAREREAQNFSTTMLRKANYVAWVQRDDSDTFYARLPNAELTRVLDIPRRRAAIEVTDVIERSGRYLILWNLGRDVVDIPMPEYRFDLEDGSTVYSWNVTTARGRRFEIRIAIKTPNEHGVAVIAGQKDPYIGWYSPAQHVSQPARVIRLTLDVTVENWAAVTTTIAPAGF